MEFNIVNEKNEFKLGNIITVFTIPESKKEIVLFSIEEFDGDTANLQIAYLNTNDEGYNYITEIDDKKIFKKAMEVVKDIMRVVNE